MTTPRFAPCKCAHPKSEHERDGFEPQCVAPSCTCLAYRPDVARTVQPASPIRPVVQQSVRQVATQSDSSRITNRDVAPREPSDDEILRGRPATVEQILAAGKRSQHKRTVALTEKIAEQIHDLRGRLQDEREAAEEKQKREAAQEAARAQIAALEEQLRAAREQLRGTPTPNTSGGSRQGDKKDCPDCGLAFANLGVHRHKKHGYRREAS